MNNLRKLIRILGTTAMLAALILSFASCDDLIGGKNEPGGNTPNQPSDTTTYKPTVEWRIHIKLLRSHPFFHSVT